MYDEQDAGRRAVFFPGVNRENIALQYAYSRDNSDGGRVELREASRAR